MNVAESFRLRNVAPVILAVLACVNTVTMNAQSKEETPTVVHNSWNTPTTLPVPVKELATGQIGGRFYNVGGKTATAVVGNNQVYNPVANTWSNGRPMPVPISNGAYAVVRGILYVFGGTTTGYATGVADQVWAYNPKTDKWSMPTTLPAPGAREGAVAVANKGIVYVIGGTTAQFTRLNNVQSYNPATNSWTEEMPLSVPKASPANGLIRTTIIAASGEAASGPTSDNEGYDVLANRWSPLDAEPNPRVATCSGAIGGNLYSAGGVPANDQAFSLNESYSLSKNKWTTKLPIPQAVVSVGSAVYKGRLWCFGGGSTGADGFQGQVYDNVQVYQP
jgi:N-acetylneuraminic acid mutarotase